MASQIVDYHFHDSPRDIDDFISVFLKIGRKNVFINISAILNFN